MARPNATEGSGAGADGRRAIGQSGMRAANERHLLTLIRRHGVLAKSELARLSGLSQQTVWVIARALEDEGLLLRGEPVRGRIGQPSVPLSLDPNGAFFLGAKIGRRSADLVLVDFCGSVRAHHRIDYPFPRPDAAQAFIAQGIAEIRASLGARADRIAGLGLAIPFSIWNWIETGGAPAHLMQAWRDIDLRAALAAEMAFPVYQANDASAACAAELAFGHNRDLRDFVYLHVGSFIGGGLVIGGAVHWGQSGNGGALGSLLVADGRGGTRQLIELASLIALERELTAAGAAPGGRWTLDHAWAEHPAVMGRWLDRAARGIAQAIIATTAVADCTAAVVDGPFPRTLHDRLLAQVSGALGTLDTAGLSLPEVRCGSIGPLAQALGGASLPLFDRYLVATEPAAAPVPARTVS